MPLPVSAGRIRAAGDASARQHGPARVRKRRTEKAGGSAAGLAGYFEMSTSLVSRRNSRPATRLIAAMMIGYHRPL